MVRVVFHEDLDKLLTQPAGERQRIYRCCSQADPAPGCDVGSHVFYESSAEKLHSRHAFSPSLPEVATALDVAVIDCEMIYTTGGMSVARVSILDGKGTQIFDELVRMSEGVEIMCVPELDLSPVIRADISLCGTIETTIQGIWECNCGFSTSYARRRFSGITSLADAVLDLAGIRTALDSFIDASTIVVGHAVDNDLKTLRMVHQNIVDTALLFSSRAGPSFRPALRDLYVLQTLLPSK